MSIKLFHKLVSIDEALRNVMSKIVLQPRGIEEVELSNALHRVLAVDVYAPIDHPPFDRSEVDGYAVKSINVANATELNPATLSIEGFIRPGDHGNEYTCEKGAVKISTGAIVPRDCDAVVMEEYVERENSLVKIFRSVAPGENISTCGSDVSSGDFLLSKGTLLRHEHIALLAGLGFRKIPVYTRPRATVYSTGNEVVEPGENLQLGKIYDVNGFLITAFLREHGVDAVYRGILPDEYRLIKERITNDLREYDMVFTSGGTSAGETDLIYRVFEDIGEIVVHGLKTKPGKPTVIAVSNGKLLFGLPGFPLSCYMILVRLVKPIVFKLTGARLVEEKINVKIPFKIRKGIGKTWLIPSVIVETPSGLTAYPVSLSSGSIYAITFSDGFVELSEELDVVEANSIVPFYAFNERYRTRKLIIIGSNDPLLENLLVKTGLIYVSRILNTGSMGGWLAVSRGEADIAPTHLLDPETGIYNVTYLDKYGLRNKAILVRGYDRLIGFIVRKGNPKNIRNFEDFLREDVRIVNRPRGSGIRVLVDLNLKKIVEKKGLSWNKIHEIIKGYTYEVKTHTAVAVAVKQGKADVGVASGYVAELFELDFIPIGWEEYDFLIPLDKLNKAEVQAFIEAIKSLEINDFKFKKYYRIPANAGLPKENH
ncbi:MAG: molybdopterin biosynthesis protein [Desulfurococcaceae archaeon]